MNLNIDRTDHFVRPANERDKDAIWTILEPTIRAGETYALPQGMNKSDALTFWFSNGHEVFVVQSHGKILGTYFLRANQKRWGRTRS